MLRTANLEQNTKETMKHLVSLMDLEIPNDYLRYLNLDYSPKSFDSEIFSKKLFGGLPTDVNLGKILKPKEFNLPEDFPEYEDFSEQILKIHEKALSCFRAEMGIDMIFEDQDTESTDLEDMILREREELYFCQQALEGFNPILEDRASNSGFQENICSQLD